MIINGCCFGINLTLVDDRWSPFSTVFGNLFPNDFNISILICQTRQILTLAPPSAGNVCRVGWRFIRVPLHFEMFYTT
jgi:hypothetical protein